jgi:protein ImuB
MTVRIPSYDDLTPSIPDVSPSEAFTSVGRLLPASGPVARRAAAATLSSCALFACVRSVRLPQAAFDIAREFSPRVERHGAACVVLDVAGLGRLLGDAVSIGAELDRAAAARGTGITVAVASSQMAALLLSLARDSPAVATNDPGAALADVPMATLRRLLAELHGVAFLRARATRAVVPMTGPSASAWPSWPACEIVFDVLHRWGLGTLGEFAALPATDLSARMGQAGVALQRLACGIDPRPLAPDPGVPRYIERLELEWPVETLEPLSFVLARLLDPLSIALERADRGAVAIRLDLRLVDRSIHTRLLQLPVAMRDPRVLRTLLVLDLESHPPPAAIDIVTIEIDPAPGRVVQYSLLERAMPSAETLATLDARLGALVGEGRYGTPELLDTHQPDGFAMQRFAPPERAQASAGVRWPTVDHHAAVDRLVPQAPATLRPCLRRFRPPVAVRVAVERGRPVRVAIDRRGMPGGPVEQCAGPWRTSGAWWTSAVVHWDRDEWDVALSDGSLCRLFRDRHTGVWFLEGLLD